MLNADASRDSAYFTLSIRALRLVHNQLAIFYAPPLLNYYYYTLMLDNNNNVTRIQDNYFIQGMVYNINCI